MNNVHWTYIYVHKWSTTVAQLGDLCYWDLDFCVYLPRCLFLRCLCLFYLREGGLNLEALPKHWVELFWDVVLLVRDSLVSKLQHQVGVSFSCNSTQSLKILMILTKINICLAIYIHGVEVVGLDDVDPHQHPRRLVAWQPLQLCISFFPSSIQEERKDRGEAPQRSYLHLLIP